jgi:hypothetical protein
MPNETSKNIRQKSHKKEVRQRMRRKGDERKNNR